MLKMRLQRVGRKHEPTFRLVLTDSKNSTKSGRFKEILGSYDPRKSVDSIKADRVKELLAQGVSPTDTVHNLLVTHKIIEGKKRNVLPKKTVEKKEEPVVEAQPTPVSETPLEEASVKAPVEESAPVAEAEPDAPSEETTTEDPVQVDENKE